MPPVQHDDDNQTKSDLPIVRGRWCLRLRAGVGNRAGEVTPYSRLKFVLMFLKVIPALLDCPSEVRAFLTKDKIPVGVAESVADSLECIFFRGGLLLVSDCAN